MIQNQKFKGTFDVKTLETVQETDILLLMYP